MRPPRPKAHNELSAKVLQARRPRRVLAILGGEALADGVEVLRLDGEMQLAPGPLSAGGGVKVPHVLNLDGIVFTRSGHYTFDVSVDGRHHVSIPLSVIDAGGSALA